MEDKEKLEEISAEEAETISAPAKEEPAENQPVEETLRESHLHKRKERKKKKRMLHIWLNYAIDILITGILLLVFALFHHVIPASEPTVGKELPTVSQNQLVMEPISTPTLQPSVSMEAEPTATPIIYEGQFGGLFEDKFTDGEPIWTENSYTGKNISVTIDKINYSGDANYFVADIYVRDLKYLRAAFAGNGEFISGKSDEVKNMAAENNGILAISGDYCGFSSRAGYIVRNGLLYRDKAWEDVCVLYQDGEMVTYENNEFDLETMSQRGIWQIWSFGPMLLDDGNVMEKFNSRLNPQNPRTAIGYFEPGHYCFVVVEGRIGNVNGFSTKEMSQLMYDLGCKAAYNLDGGGTAAMVFNGELLNVQADGGRGCSDIIYVTDTWEDAQ